MFSVIALLIGLLCHNVLALEHGVAILNEKNWKQTLHGEWMIKFFDPGCAACKEIEANYDALARSSSSLKINVGAIDVSKNAGLSGRFMVTTLPALFHGIDGQFHRYNKERSVHNLRRYVKEQEWRGTEPISWLRHPDTYQMSVMSWIFKAWFLLEKIHAIMSDRFGLSMMEIHTVIASLTLMAGLVLGFVLSSITELMSPTTSSSGEGECEMTARTHLSAETRRMVSGETQYADEDDLQIDVTAQDETRHDTDGSSRLRKRKHKYHAKEAGDAPGVKLEKKLQ